SDSYLNEYFESCIENQPGFRNWVDKVRIACFGSEPDSLLMWSHYGDGLRGFSIVFDETVLLEQEGKGFVVDVDYVIEPPICDAFVWAVADGLVEYNETELAELSGKHCSVSSEGMSESEIRSELDRSLLVQQKILRALFATKPIEWQYERERRFLFQANIDGTEPLLASFPEQAIQAVLIGERMPSDYQHRLEAVLSQKYRHAQIQTVKRSLTEYRLVVD
ncbi:MAG: DUF2971 domain-containing protein, partial [Paracoccaceae bacterium]